MADQSGQNAAAGTGARVSLDTSGRRGRPIAHYRITGQSAHDLGPRGQRQLIRVIRTSNAPTPDSSELAYRVVVDEIPGAEQPSGVQFAVRYSIPVFVQAPNQPDTAAPALVWSIVKDGAKIWLQASNTGQRRAQIVNATFTPVNGKPIVLSSGLYGYTLAGNTRIWQLKEHGKAMLAGGILNAKINQLPQQFVIPGAKNAS